MTAAPRATRTQTIIALLVFLTGVALYTALRPPARPAPITTPRFVDIASTYESRLAADPQNIALLTQTANLYYDHQDYARAADLYRRALARSPKDPDLHGNLGLSLWQQGQTEAAIAEFQAALHEDPDHARALDALGLAYLRGRHDVSSARTAWQHLLQVHPGYSGRRRIDALLGSAR